MEATTQSGGQPTTSIEGQFDSLWDAGAFDLANEKPKPEAVEAQSEDRADTRTEQPPQDAQQATQEPEEPEGPEYESLDHFLTENKLDPESFRALPVTVKIDGETKTVPLSDVIKSYQLESHVHNKSAQVAEVQRQVEAERQAAREIVRQQLTQNQALADLGQQMLTQEYQRVDWNHLRISNPAEYAAKFTEFQQRQAQITQYVQQVQGQQAQAQQAQQQDLARLVQIERQKMLEIVPEWTDPQKFTADAEVMQKYAKSNGFTEQELSNLFDHRMMRILHDAARYGELKAAKPEALKKVRAAPNQTAKPGARNIKNPVEAKRAQVVQRVLSNPRDSDALASAFEMFAA